MIALATTARPTGGIMVDWNTDNVLHLLSRAGFGDLEIASCPTVRESDGLAMSSRNRYLGAEERRRATALWRGIEAARSALAGIARVEARAAERAAWTLIEREGLTVDYAVVRDAETLMPVSAEPSTPARTLRILIAARLGAVRLIDNAAVREYRELCTAIGALGHLPPRASDLLVSRGERLSAQILAAAIGRARRRVYGCARAHKTSLCPNRLRLPLERVDGAVLHAIVDQVLTSEERADEYLLMGLRLAEGIDLARYQAFAGRPLDAERIALLRTQGALEFTPSGRLRVTRDCFALLDAVVADLAA